MVKHLLSVIRSPDQCPSHLMSQPIVGSGFSTVSSHLQNIQTLPPPWNSHAYDQYSFEWIHCHTDVNERRHTMKFHVPSLRTLHGVIYPDPCLSLLQKRKFHFWFHHSNDIDCSFQSRCAEHIIHTTWKWLIRRWFIERRLWSSYSCDLTDTLLLIPLQGLIFSAFNPSSTKTLPRIKEWQPLSSAQGVIQGLSDINAV